MGVELEQGSWEKLGENGMLTGTISIRITEEEDVHESRDAAVRALDDTLKIVKQMTAAEAKMRKRISEGSNAFMKEREAHTKERMDHGSTKQLLEQISASHSKLLERVEQLEAELKAAKTLTLAKNKANRKK